MSGRSFLCLCGFMAAWLLLGLMSSAREAEARGASKEESAQAKEIFERLKTADTSTKLTRKMLSGNGTYTLAPGEVLNFDVRGYCLDHQFSAPSQNEPLAFRPMTHYVAPDLRDLYIRVLRKSGSSAAQSADVQKIVWAMRTSASASWTEGLSSKDKNFLNGAMPGGTALLQRAHRPSEYLSGSGSGGGHNSRQGGGDAGAVLQALLPQLVRQLPFNVQQHSNELMHQLQNRRAQKPMPDSSNRYSMLTTSGVAGTGMSLGGLLVRGSLANGSQESFDFDPTQWVLESARDVQAVALPPMKKIAVNKGKALPNTMSGSSPEDARPQSSPRKSKTPEEHEAPEEQFNQFTNIPVK